MSEHYSKKIEQDCVTSLARYPEVVRFIAHKRIAIVGGTGFIGSWLTRMIAMANDVHSAGATVDLYARSSATPLARALAMSDRKDVQVHKLDVRSAVEFHAGTQLVIFAAGLPDNRIHASDPLRVYHTTVMGMSNCLMATSRLGLVERFVNISSGLVSGLNTQTGLHCENLQEIASASSLHQVYIEAKRSAEMLASVYRSQFRLPVITVRPFTVAGPFQRLDAPWALNSFVRDALAKRNVRIHGDGLDRRTYMYGSDVAALVLLAMTKGVDGDIFNVGGSVPVSHIELADLVCDLSGLAIKPIVNTQFMNAARRAADFLPDNSFTSARLGYEPSFSLRETVEKTYDWFSLQV